MTIPAAHSIPGSRLRPGAGNNAQVKWLRAALAVASFLVLACGGAGRSQSPAIDSSQFPRVLPHQQNFAVAVADDPIAEERRQRALNVERQKQLVSDADKLLKLAKELNAEVASSRSGAWTPEQLRKIAVIEKLAREVREKMLAGAGSPASFITEPASSPVTR
jgi:hypothetical protein